MNASSFTKWFQLFSLISLVAANISWAANSDQAYRHSSILKDRPVAEEDDSVSLSNGTDVYHRSMAPSFTKHSMTKAGLGTAAIISAVYLRIASQDGLTKIDLPKSFVDDLNKAYEDVHEANRRYYFWKNQAMTIEEKQKQMAAIKNEIDQIVLSHADSRFMPKKEYEKIWDLNQKMGALSLTEAYEKSLVVENRYLARMELRQAEKLRTRIEYKVGEFLKKYDTPVGRLLGIPDSENQFKRLRISGISGTVLFLSLVGITAETIDEANDK